MLLNMYFDMPLLAQLQQKTVDILESKDIINFSGLLQTARLLKKRNYYCLGNMKPCHCVQYCISLLGEQ